MSAREDTTWTIKEKNMITHRLLCGVFIICVQCTAVKAVLSSVLSTTILSDISHLLSLDTISTKPFLSLLFVKVFTELCHLWAASLRQARRISQPVNLQSNTSRLPISLRE